MKAALNGVPSLSVLDGWWIEGHVEGVTGWSIGRRDGAAETSDEEDARHLYAALEDTILPSYADRPAGWGEVMRLTIALNASFFNAQRMLQEYMIHAYQDQDQGSRAAPFVKEAPRRDQCLSGRVTSSSAETPARSWTEPAGWGCAASTKPRYSGCFPAG